MTRTPRILWANCYCLLDTSSGAAMEVREMLHQLALRGIEVKSLGATHFDHERGMTAIKAHWEQLSASKGRFVCLGDGGIDHQVLVTASTVRQAMTSAEEAQWFAMYEHCLESCRPDLVMYYGGQPLDFLLAAEARRRHIPVAFYLANGSYFGSARWCRDVDLILTNSRANAQRYQERLQIAPIPLGAFINRGRVVAAEHRRTHLLFINPVLEKGAAIVVRLALMLEARRPDIRFEVVESRGQWPEVVNFVTAALGTPRESLPNVTVTPNTTDMRPLYGRARLLLAPSLWWEGMGRVLAEAMLNGIPAIVTDNGGMPEMIGDAGIALKLDDSYHQPPYALVPSEAALAPLVEFIIRLYDDEAEYARWVARAERVGRESHRIEDATERLLEVLAPLLAGEAGKVE